MIILQSLIAKIGPYSRRQAEVLIREGRVQVNGKAAELGMRAGAEDKIEIDAKRLGELPELTYLALYKPAGYTCTKREFKNEKNIYTLLPAEYQDLHAIGRLDKDSRGLIILTNDGALTQTLTHPRFGHEKEYVVVAKTPKKAPKNYSWLKISRALMNGVDIGEGDGVVRPKKCELISEGKFRIVLTEGKKRQIRRMFRACGLTVADLLRVRVMSLDLGTLKEGEFRVIDKKEIL
jgi:pseudouridine synthase